MIEISEIFYTEPQLLVYKINNQIFNIKKKFKDLNFNEIKKFINISTQFSNEFIPTISIQINPDFIPSNKETNLDLFINNFLLMNDYQKKELNYSLNIISEFNDELYGIFDFSLTNEGIHFFINNSCEELNWFLAIFENDKIIGKSTQLNIRNLSQYYKELEFSL